jgi:arylsulfatase A-like enzyme
MRALKWVGVLAAAALLAPSAATASRPPNILLIVTDDQRYDSMAVMPRTERIFAGRGVSYPEAFVTTPLCCPSRASIFSGQYAHNHGVFDNSPPFGAEDFDPSNSWEHDLRRAGYVTGIVGKYLNGISAADAPHFTFRRATPEGATEPPIDLSDVDMFLASADSHDRKPWALVLAVHSPHYPFTVRPQEPRPIPPFDPPPSFGERNLGDKDPAVAAGAADFDPAQAQSIYLGQDTELEAVDETVQGTFKRLAAHEEEHRTLAIFLSDNGLLQGEHGLMSKRWPYLSSVRTPLFARWPGHLPPGTVDGRIAANIDLAPTIEEAAGVTPSYVQDGRSLLSPSDRTWLLLEGPTPSHVPGWNGSVSPSREYIEWDDGFVENYDLGTDPWERRASNAHHPKVEARIAAARTCAGTACP